MTAGRSRKDLRGHFMEKKKEETKRCNESGIEVKPLYTREDMKGLDPEKDIGEPGDFPYTRGIHRTMYRDRLWTMRQYSGFGTPRDSNQRYKYLLEQGQTGLSVALDLPTQMGLDPDDPMSLGEVGRVGVCINTLKDMETLFEGLALDKITTSFTINATAAMLLAMYLCVAEKQGVPFHKVGGTIQNDILKEYVARGAWIYPPQFSVRLIVDTIEYCAQHAPRFNPISISGAHFRDAGCTAAQEAAFTLADAVEYVQAVLDRGLPVDDFAGQLSFYFYTHNNLFEEVAKYRAMRKLWAKLMKERFKAKNPRSWLFRFGVVCGGSTLMPQQHEINTIRVSYQALASVLGGVQSMFTCAMDEPFSIPTEETARLALRIQQVLGFETGVADTADPLGGSYFVERLTRDMEQETYDYFETIDRMGGMVVAIEHGYPQREVAESAYSFQQAVERRDKIIVGINGFVAETEEPLPILYIDETVGDRQVARLEKLRRERDNDRVRRALDDLRKTAGGTGNLMYPLLEAARSYATVGEMCDALRDVWGEYVEVPVI